MFFQAVNTSMFFSLLTVLGNIAPFPHGITVALSDALVAKGEGSPCVMSSFSILERQGCFSGADDGLSGDTCGAAGESEEEAGEVLDLKGAPI
jgi:hypothetical protein